MAGRKRSRLVLPRPQYKLLCYEVHERDKWRCRVCGARQDLHAHHIVYRSHGGDDASWNLITVCHYCHDQGIHRNLVLVVAKSGKLDDPVNADEGVVIVRLNGWRPKRC